MEHHFYRGGGTANNRKNFGRAGHKKTTKFFIVYYRAKGKRGTRKGIFTEEQLENMKETGQFNILSIKPKK